jgi:glycosyltransferase involved in cell wall biosynthesis
VTRLDVGERYKGIATVIEAYSMLPDNSMRCFVIGHGDPFPFLQVVAERWGVKDRVHFVRGTDPALRDHLRANGRSLVVDGGQCTFARFTQRCAQVFGLDETVAA